MSSSERWLVAVSALWAMAAAGALGAEGGGGGVWWDVLPSPTRNDIVNAMTDFIPRVYAAQRRRMAEAQAGAEEAEAEAEEAYDFVVVGAGAAGSALAARLSEQPQWRVLLLEAGESQVPVMSIPFFLGQFHATDANWQLLTTPQNHSCAGMEQARCDYPQGRALGGSTAINYMFNIRGNRRDFDAWAAAGNRGWSWEDLLPLFQRVEDLRIPALARRPGRGYGGAIRSSYAAYFSPMGELLLQAARQAGWAAADDYNAGEQPAGLHRIQSTTWRGARWSAEAGYLRAATRRPNLRVLTRATATTILFEGHQAVGVRYERGGRELVARAAKEVVVCAGAVHSAALLLRSGVGPAAHLRSVGVPLLKDLPVGDNLMDHAALLASSVALNRSVAPGVPEALLSPATHADYFLRRPPAGPLTGTGTFETVSFHELQGTPFHSPGWPQVEILHSSVSAVPNPRFASLFRIPPLLYERMLAPVEHKAVAHACVFRLRPRSRGTVRLAAADPRLPPLVDPRANQHPEDAAVLLAGVREYQRLLRTPALRSVDAQILRPAAPGLPGCEGLPFDSNEYWLCAARQTAITLYHPCGTCKMAPAGDPTAVVTPDLKVVGLRGLRVADSSIVPEIVSGHLQMTAYVIGEKAAELIKAEHS